MPSWDRRKYIDITSALDGATRAYPGDPPFRMQTVSDTRRGDPARVSSLSLGTHAGTHMDAPSHLPGGLGGVESLSLDSMIGPALVFEAPCGLVGPLDLERLHPNTPPRILFKGAPEILPQGAAELVRRGFVLVGTDGISIDPMGDRAMPSHRILISAGVVLLEGLDLSSARPGRYDLIALPLLIPGADGAPARAVLRARRAPAGPRPVVPRRPA